MPRYTRTLRNFKKQGQKYTDFLRTFIDPRKSNVVRKTLGYVSRKISGRSSKKSRRRR